MARPREFNEEVVLDKALDAFWANGYVATSMSDLMEAMNLNKGSIYAAFGDKHSLFLDALKHYSNSIYTNFNSAFKDISSPYEGMRTFLTEVFVDFLVDSQFNKGCFSINSIVELAPHDEEIKNFLKFHMNRIEIMLKKNIEKGQKSGQYRTDISAEQLAKIIKKFMIGSCVNSKTGGSRTEAKKSMEAIFDLIVIK